MSDEITRLRAAIELLNSQAGARAVGARMEQTAPPGALRIQMTH